jgi:hypothetical protein
MLPAGNGRAKKSADVCRVAIRELSSAPAPSLLPPPSVYAAAALTADRAVARRT